MGLGADDGQLLVGGPRRRAPRQGHGELFFDSGVEGVHQALGKGTGYVFHDEELPVHATQDNGLRVYRLLSRSKPGVGGHARRQGLLPDPVPAQMGQGLGQRPHQGVVGEGKQFVVARAADNHGGGSHQPLALLPSDPAAGK